MKTTTQSRLKEVFSFDPEIGRLFWTNPTARNVKIGSIAGRLTKDGYRRVCLDGFAYPEHKLIWLYFYGKFPDGEIDHINHIRDDNRIPNMRDVPRTQNNKNKSIGKNNSSGVIGVCWDKQGKNWKAAITVNSKKIHLGYFKDLKEAIQARKSANLKYRFHENHGK
jgi:hypothetical protein